MNRTKNASRNILFGTILKLYQILVPFLMRTAMIYFMGAEYLGLNSLFTSVLQVLNLAELGVGSAMVYSMYKPIAEGDTSSICALMRLYKIYYRVIGTVVLILGIILLPFIPRLIKGNVPAGINVYVLYLLNLGATVFSYWLFAYKNSVLMAHQRADVTSKVQLITDTIKYLVQIFVLIFLHNYYYYVITILVTQIITNIATAYCATQLYPDYKPQGKLDKESVKNINGRIKDLFTSKLGGVIVNSADTIVISAFLGLTALAIYQNYYFLLSSVSGFIIIIFNSCTAGIGNSLIVETKEKNYTDFKKFNFIIAWIAGFCTTCFLCLYQPFMEFWVGKELMVAFPIVICFCIYFYLIKINGLLNLYKDSAGIWHEDRFRPLVTALVNLAMNLLLVERWGLYGVILSTVLSTLFVGMPWLLHNLFTVIFDKKYLKEFISKNLYYVFVTVMIGIVTYFACSFVKLPLLWELIVKLIICCILPNICFWIIYRKKKEFEQSLELADKMTKGKVGFLKKISN